MTDPSVPIVPGGAPVAQAPYMPPPSPPPPPKHSYTGLVWIIVGCLAVVLLGVTAFAVSVLRPRPGDGGSEASDVAVTGCSTTAAGNLRAQLRVTNSTSRERSYFITVAFNQGNTRVADADAYIRDVAPGQSAEDEAVALVRNSPSGFRCVVSKVRRV